MSRELEFEVSWEQPIEGPENERVTYGSLSVSTSRGVVTRVEDRISKTTRESIRVALYPLAMWLASNFWRLRWESTSGGGTASPDWKMAHHLAAAGSGYLWPDLRITSAGRDIRLHSRETAGPSSGTIAYLGNIDVQVRGEDFVDSVSELVEAVIGRLREFGQTDTPLERMWSLVQQERADRQQREYRRLEAVLGFDPEKAPTGRIETLLDAGGRLGSEAVAEIVAGTSQEFDWEDLETQLRQSDKATIDDLEQLRQTASAAAQGRFAWERGEAAAREVRRAIGVDDGAMRDDLFVDWLSLPDDALTNPAIQLSSAFAAGFRDEADATEVGVAFRSDWRTGRRFEIARLIGEHLFTAPEDDHVMPATGADTVRQSTQRAFAAELLVPTSELRDHVAGASIDDERIEEIARAYEVSPLMIETKLVNKGLLERRL